MYITYSTMADLSTFPDRALATIVKIIDIVPIEGADRIMLATVLGWQVVIKKDELKVGDLVIYFTIGSILDDSLEYAKFLEGKYLRTRKIRGVISQGLVGLLSWLSEHKVDPAVFKEGDDVTTVMNVKKVVLQEEAPIYSEEGLEPWPKFIPKTQEERVQNIPQKLTSLESNNVVITQKYDGTSVTYYTLNKVFSICGRNFKLTGLTRTTEHYFEVAKECNLEQKMLALNRNIAVQGEIIGPKIGGNRHKVYRLSFNVFNVYDIDTDSYLQYDDVVSVAKELGLNTVTLVYRGPLKHEWSIVKGLLALAEDQKYESGNIAEGIVCKTNCGFPRMSFKAISNKYLLDNNL